MGGGMRLLVTCAALLLATCKDADSVFTLYRNSTTGPMRIHVATFDATEPAGYNHENCEAARNLFAAQHGVRVRYWCEQGRFGP